MHYLFPFIPINKVPHALFFHYLFIYSLFILFIIIYFFFIFFFIIIYPHVDPISRWPTFYDAR